MFLTPWVENRPDLWLAMLTVPAAVAVAAWMLNGRFHVGSMRNVFLAIAAYFALCVPIDLLLGLELRGSREFLADLNDDMFRVEIVRGLVLYFECILCFLIAYSLGPHDPKPRHRTYGLSLPPLWVALGVNAACMLLYISVFGSVSRIDRFFLARNATFYKLLSLVVPATYAFNFLYVLRSPDRRSARWLVAASLVFSFISGGRMWGAAMLLFYLVRYRVTMRRWQVVTLGTVFVAASLVWKEVTGYFWETGMLPSLWNPDMLIGLSRFEGIQSWVMTVEILSEGASPWWGGWSYTVLPLRLLWPRFLLEFPPQTLSEQYAEFLRPTLFEAGGGIGFSAIGEAWLNFGFLGPGLLGLAWGAAARWIDRRPHGVAMIVFVIMTLRLFRSDFGSLCKSWAFMFTVTLLLVIVLWKLADSAAAMLRGEFRDRRGQVRSAPSGTTPAAMLSQS